MAAVETGQPRSHGKSKKKKQRVDVRIDLTPMVDVVLLMLTFFMLTTVFSKPQSIELNLPDRTIGGVPTSSLLTLRVGPDFRIYWNAGAEPKLQKVAFKDLCSFLVERSRSNPKLITLIKVDREATYASMVDVMDVLNLANITRFSLAPMQEADKKLIAKAG